MAYKTKDEKLVNQLRAWFLEAKRADEARRKENKEVAKFYDGEQWDEDQKKVLKERKQPIVVINRIKPKVDSIIGMELKLSVDTKAFPRGKVPDEQMASPWSEVFRYIEHRSDFDGQESEAFEEASVIGRSWYKTRVKWDGLDPEILTDKVDDDDMFLDPYCKKPDLSDAKYVNEAVWMDLEDAKDLWPGKSKKLEAMHRQEPKDFASADIREHYEEQPDQWDGNSQGSSPIGWVPHFVDKKRKRVLIVSCWYRKPSMKKIISSPSGIIDVSNENDRDIKKSLDVLEGSELFIEKQFTLNTGVFCGDILLEKKEDIKPWDKDAKFDHVLVYIYRYKHKEKRGQHYGLVKQMMDPQREVNMRRSKMLHQVSTNQIIAEDGALQSPTDTRMEVNKPDGNIIYQRGYQFQIRDNLQLSQSQFMLLQEAKAEIDNTGIQGEVSGGGGASSGKEFQLRHEAAIQPLGKPLHNMRRGRLQVAQLWIEYVKELWPIEKILKIVEDPQIAQMIKQADTKYNIIIEEGQQFTNLQSEEFANAAKLAGVGFPPQLIIEMSNLRPERKKQVSQMFQAQAQAQQQQQSGGKK